MVFACSGIHAAMVDKEGYEIYPIFTIDPIEALAKTRLFGSAFNRLTVEKYIDAEVELIEKILPDVIIGDFRLTLSISCKLKRVPYVALLNAYWTNYYAIPFTAPESLFITRLLGKKVVTAGKEFLLRLYARPFNKISKIKGCSTCKNIFDVMTSPDLNLLVDMPEYAPCRNLPPHFKYIGPIFWEKSGENYSGFPKLEKHKPVIYITMGSTGYKRLFEELVGFFSNKNYQVIMTTGEKIKFPVIPNNFYVQKYLPGSKVMEVTNLCICHGGNGTIYQALSKGVPIIGIPAIHDQSFNMDRVVDLGLGIKLSAGNFKCADLDSAIDEILTNPNYQRNAKRFQKIIERYDAASQGAKIIEEFISKDN